MWRPALAGNRIRAFIAGAQGGCQAEIGSASAMAAGGAVHLRGGSAEAVAHAAAMALKNLLGLVCDPVAGLVEVPCVKQKRIRRGCRPFGGRHGACRSAQQNSSRRGD